jgi:hypothetical protein
MIKNLMYKLLLPYPFLSYDKSHNLEIHLYDRNINDPNAIIKKIYFNTAYLLLYSNTFVDYINDNCEKQDQILIFPLSINQFNASDLETGSSILIKFLTHLIRNSKINKTENNILQMLYLIDIFQIDPNAFDFSDVEFDRKIAFDLIHYDPIENYPVFMKKIDIMIGKNKKLILRLINTKFSSYPDIEDKIENVVKNDKKLALKIMTNCINSPNNIGSIIGNHIIDFFRNPFDPVIDNFLKTRYKNNENEEELYDIFSWHFTEPTSGIYLSNIIIYLIDIAIDPLIIVKISTEVIIDNQISLSKVNK